MTRFERYFKDKPFKCAMCNHPVIYNDEKGTVKCGCGTLQNMKMTAEEMRKQTLQGVYWKKTTIL